MGNLSTGIGGQSYYDLAQQGLVFSALASVTSPTIWSTNTATGGPLLWNNTGTSNNRVKAVLLALGVGISTASGAGSALGITGGITTAPSSTTAIDAVANMLIGGSGPATPRCNVFRVGTVSAAGTFFQPTHSLDTAALTAIPLAMQWVDLHGAIVVEPTGFASVAASATATSAVLSIGLLWAEIPY